jgi:hypothetical protein
MSTKISRLFVALVWLLPALAGAKALFVNNSGTPACSDSTSYAANDSSRPWCTIGRATWGTTNPMTFNSSEAARAGDTVNIMSGSYVTPGRNTTGSSCRWTVALQSANSGTSGNPVTYRGIGAVNISLAAGYYGPTIGSSDSRNHIVWDNVRIDEQTAQGSSCRDTGPVVFNTCIGCKLLNSSVRGTYRTWGDNYNAVRIEGAREITVANNVLSNITGNFGHNSAAIMSYDAENVLIEHNYIHSNVTGIYIKGDHAGDAWPQATHTVRYNRFANNSNKGIFVYAGVNHSIYQNLVIDSPQAIVLNVNSATTVNTRIANNTIVATTPTSVGISLEGANPAGGLVHNNIIYGPFSESMNLGLQTPGGMTFEHNVYFGFGSWGSAGGSVIAFSTWQGTYGRDRASPAGIVTNPLFAETTTYKLQAASPARTRGIDILDLNGNGDSNDVIPAGAYVTGNEIIGPTTGGPAGGVLPAPTNLRVN